ncbi:MAG: hypothetical protein M5U34_43080 [Chloroflexi bacterium]|nr:hypothetical protein [Chloroflexota bacterium]
MDEPAPFHQFFCGSSLDVTDDDKFAMGAVGLAYVVTPLVPHLILLMADKENGRFCGRIMPKR